MKLFFLFLILVNVARATPVDYFFEVVVDSLTVNYSTETFKPEPPTSLGSLLTGSFHFDTEAVDQDPSQNYGAYYHTLSLPMGLNFLGQSYNAPGGVVTAHVTNDGPPLPGFLGGDLLSVAGTSDGNSTFWLGFNDPSGAWFSSDIVPASIPFGPELLGQFSYIEDAVSASGASANFAVSGHIVSLTSIPEPSIPALLAAMLGFGYSRRRNSAVKA